MQRQLAVLLTAALIIPAVLKLGIMINYVVAYDLYVTELCENRDRPAMQCNGQCHLTKALKSLEPSDQKSEEHTIPPQLSAELTFLIPAYSKSEEILIDLVADYHTANEAMIAFVFKDVTVPPPEHSA